MPGFAFAEILNLACASRSNGSASNYSIDMTTHVVHSSGLRLKGLALISDSNISFYEEFSGGLKFLITINRNTGGMDAWNASSGPLVWDGAYDCTKAERQF